MTNEERIIELLKDINEKLGRLKDIEAKIMDVETAIWEKECG